MLLTVGFAATALLGCSSESGTDEAGSTSSAPEIEAPPAGLGSGMPHLFDNGESVVLSWLEPTDPDDVEAAWALKVSELSDGQWGTPQTITEREGMFINWADFPSVTVAGGVAYAHWLQRGPAGGYDYSVTMQGNATGSEPETFVVHDDQSPVEHGFVSTVALPNGRMGVVWLDGRDFTGAEPHEMQVRYREVGPEGPATHEVLLDERACDCCQTDLAQTGSGLVAVYRDRSPAEIRDISVVRNTGQGWSEPVRVHDDGWEIAGCPVNGPAIAAEDDDVAVAWFTGAHDTARVKVALSRDGGVTFGEPVQIDDGAPVGRVDVVLLAGESQEPTIGVSWVERTAGEGKAEVRLRFVRDSEAGPSSTVAGTTAARSSGFPQMVPAGDHLLLVWTDDQARRLRASLHAWGAS